ncbi:molybdopterin binding oxidoreductase [Westerdykella ornata]|uniref:Molybdopterin binding oxidoreductase n=1 Tax=Westerdykella ornata TaxID=318751 RepID=A0A6A6J8A9_WESOR|nr:molybdopterin binding oxidoreductase [Westerdykella ornata]KAF2272652.1 molybdopterin binding oxidoreductase [Westerdykella ornata]
MVHLEYSVEEPLNREPELPTLVSSFITPTSYAYDRNHGPIPHIDASTHRITVSGHVQKELSLSVEDLKALPQKTVICALQCAGNRRHTMRTKLKEVNGVDWFDGAVMNCRWRGPLLLDVISLAGISLPESELPHAHITFSSHQTPCQDDSYYGASLPLPRALSPSSSILLALEMNDAPLTPNHGAPVRVITPGIAGARSVKWLDKIEVSLKESPNYYQQHDYKILPPEAKDKESAEQWWGKVDAIMDMPVNSVVAVPGSGERVERGEDGCIEVRGYALPSGTDGPVVKVEVSGDGGETWTEAAILERQEEEVMGAELKWAWSLWRARVRVESGEGRRVLSRAVDSKGNTQAECPEWNYRGVAYNGYGEATGLHVV